MQMVNVECSTQNALERIFENFRGTVKLKIERIPVLDLEKTTIQQSFASLSFLLRCLISCKIYLLGF